MIPQIRTPSNARLLDAWEAGRAQHVVDRALTLLRTFTGAGRDALADLTVGQRDRLLVDVRRRFFGDALEAICTCEQCDEQNEFIVDAAQLPSDDAQLPDVLRVATEPGEIVARLPTSRDLAAVALLPEADAAHALLARCVVTGDRDNEIALAKVDDALAQAELLPALELTFACSECGAPNSVPFDALMFLWSDVAEVCRRLLVDVDRLASAYGWSESAILRMSADRRAAYVELVR